MSKFEAKLKTFGIAKANMFPTSDTVSIPDERVLADFTVVGREGNYRIRHCNDERPIRVDGAPVMFSTIADAEEYAVKFKA